LDLVIIILEQVKLVVLLLVQLLLVELVLGLGCLVLFRDDVLLLLESVLEVVSSRGLLSLRRGLLGLRRGLLLVDLLRWRRFHLILSSDHLFLKTLVEHGLMLVYTRVFNMALS
jgi:hypothetical protein